MSTIKPFRALRPKIGEEKQIASPPYDVLNSEEARELAKGNPLSFLHVVKPEIDLPEGTGIYSDEVYQMGKANLEKLVTDGHLVREDKPCFYLYRQIMQIDGRYWVSFRF